MNERIKELVGQATTYIEPTANSGEGWIFDKEKFAELIVKECIDQASIGNGHGNNQWDRALTFAANNIKDHFGVK